MIVRTKTVNDGYVKGVIVTADTLRDLHRWLEDVQGSADHKEGARHVVNFLDNMYDRIR
jgi:hypothetical protein